MEMQSIAVLEKGLDVAGDLTLAQLCRGHRGAGRSSMARGLARFLTDGRTGGVRVCDAAGSTARAAGRARSRGAAGRAADAGLPSPADPVLIDTQALERIVSGYGGSIDTHVRIRERGLPAGRLLARHAPARRDLARRTPHGARARAHQGDPRHPQAAARTWPEEGFGEICRVTPDGAGGFTIEPAPRQGRHDKQALRVPAVLGAGGQ